jgi:hypothetical protein
LIFAGLVPAWALNFGGSLPVFLRLSFFKSLLLYPLPIFVYLLGCHDISLLL